MMENNNDWFENLNFSSTVSNLFNYLYLEINLDMIELYLLNEHILAQYSIYRH